MSQLIEKKNRQMYFDGANEHQRFGIRKLTIGAASVLLGATLFLGGHAQEAHADTLNTSAPMENNTSTGEEAASQELNNASQDYVPNNPTVEQAETPSAGTTQSQPASVTSETQSANTQSSQDQSATLNTYNANQVAQNVNVTSTINSQVQSAPTQVQGQIPEANYAQASQDQSAVLNTNNANQGASQVQSNTLNNNVANNTQEATNTSSMLANQVVQNNTNVTNVNSATNTSQNNLAINNTQDYVPNNPTNNKAKINYDALNKANEQANLVLNQPQALHAANLAMNAQNSVLRLSRNLKDNLNNVDNSKLKLFENNLMALRNTNPYLVSLASTGDDDVNISFPDDGNENQNIQDQTFTPQPGEHYDTTQEVKTVTRNIEWYIIKADGRIVPTGHTVTDTINFYEPQAQDDQGHLLDKYSWAHWNSSLDQHFRDRARETEQILKANDNIRLDHVEGGTSADVAGATLITPFSQNQNIRVYFKEGKISTLVRFLDADPNNGRTDGDQVVLSDLSIEGPNGAFINDPDQLNEIRTTLQNYLNQGYKVVDGDNPFSPQIDKDHPHADPNAVEPNIVQYRPVDGAPDNTAINIVLHHNSKDFGGDQNTPNPKTGQTDKNTQKTVTRTISYVYEDGSPVMENGQPKKVVQPVTFSRMAHVDMVTGKVTYDDWGVPKSFSAVKTPQLAGYTPDKVEVEEASVNATDSDSNVTVTYKANDPVKKDANGQVQYIDDEDNGRVLKTDPFSGKVGDPINYSTQPTINDLTSQGYELVSDGFSSSSNTTPTPHIFKDGDNNYEVHLVHHHETFGGEEDKPNPKTGEKDEKTQSVVHRIISYVYEDGKPVMDTNNQPAKTTQTLTFSRQADVDMVTGKVIYAKWDTQGTFKAITSEALDGYTPDPAVVPETTVNAESPDINVTVTYKTNAPIKRKAAHLIFKLNNTNTPNITDIHQIQSLPTMMTNGTSGSPMNDKTIPDVFTVDSSGIVSGPGYGDTSQWREIASANGVDLDAPAKAGYTWKIAKITGTDTSQDIYFVYSKAPEQSSLKVVVHDNTTNQDLTQYGYDHKDAPGTTVDYDWPTQKQHLLDNGYKIVNEPVVPSTIPNTPQTVTITVEHDIVPDNNTDHKHTPDTPINPNNPTGPKWPAKDNFTKDYTYTVNFNDQNGNKVADPQHQVSTWNRTIYVDKVTGEIKQDQSTPWTPDKPNYDNTNVPVINGYVASTTSKNGSPVSNILPGPKTEQKDTTDTVIYSTVGKIVPVDPNGNPIPGAEQPKYINDPNDPTKVTPNEKVPTIKGKTPETPTVTPQDPTKDTKVVYHDNAIDTSLKVIIHDKTTNQDLPNYGYNSGTVHAGDKVQYTFDQDRQKLIDHGYEIVNVPAIPTVYGEKPQTVTITVKHAVAPVNNQDHKHTPGTPINPNDPIGPKWPAKDNYSQDHTYTVNFSSPDGEQLADPKTQTSHWNRTLNIDKVTGEILNPNEPWKSDITNYQDTKVPVINGYVANKTSKNGSPVSKILPGAKAVPSDITDTVIYSTVGKIVPVDPNGKPIPGASTPMYENDPDDPTKVKRTDVPYIKGYTPSVDSVDPKDPTKDTNVVYQKDQPDIVPDNPNENLPSVPNDSNNDLGDFKTPEKNTEKVPAKKKVQGITKQAPVNNNTKQPVNNNAGLANKAKIPTTNVAQAATLPNKAVANQAPTNNAKKALPQTGEDQNDLMILAVGSLLSAMSLTTLAGTRRKRKHE